MLANALALAGMRPFVTIYSTFLQRVESRTRVSAGHLPDRAGSVQSHPGLFQDSLFKIAPPPCAGGVYRV